MAERAFCALGPVEEAFITGAAAAGSTRLGPELADLKTLAAAHDAQTFLDALGRATAFGRWRAADVRSTLAEWARLGLVARFATGRYTPNMATPPASSARPRDH